MVRTVAKTIVWKLIGIIALILIGLAFGVSAVKVGWVSAVYHFVTLVLYFIHERWWAKITWGRIHHDNSPLMDVD
jgi:uncharacterized membrane protein